jgi:hypothetical protein
MLTRGGHQSFAQGGFLLRQLQRLLDHPWRNFVALLVQQGGQGGRRALVGILREERHTAQFHSLRHRAQGR